jgi:hypothetical protein
MDRFDQRFDARNAAMDQANLTAQQQAKADAAAAKAEKAAKDAQALEVQRRIAKAAASPEAYYTPEQLAVIESATDADGVKQAMDLFMKMNMEKTKNRPDQITTQQIDGTNTMAIMRNGQLFNTTSTKAGQASPQARFIDLGDGTGYYADPQGNPIPQEKILRRQNLPGRGVLKNDPGATLVPAFPEQISPKLQTVYGEGLPKSMMWDPAKGSMVEVPIAPSAPATPRAKIKTITPVP